MRGRQISELETTLDSQGSIEKLCPPPAKKNHTHTKEERKEEGRKEEREVRRRRGKVQSEMSQMTAHTSIPNPEEAEAGSQVRGQS